MTFTCAKRRSWRSSAARAAGRNAARATPITPARHKAENDFVTEMDVKSEELPIRSILLAACPEGRLSAARRRVGRDVADGRWIVDPIDGTANFLQGRPRSTPSPSPTSCTASWSSSAACSARRTNEMWIGASRRAARTRNGRPIPRIR